VPKKSQSIPLNLEVFKLAVENASDHIIITDRRGLLMYGNKAMEKITGFDRFKSIGKSPGKLWGGIMPADYYKTMWKAISVDKKDFSGVMNNVRKNGEKYIAEIKISPVLDTKKQVLFYVGIERDITKEQMIDQSKTDFIRIASHQLRTPITTISWITDSLVKNLGKQNLSSIDRQYLTDLSIATRRTTDLIEDLLNLSHIQSEQNIILKPVSPLAILNEMISRVKSIPEHAERTVKIVDKALSAKVMSDEHTLKNIFQVFLTNALEYSTPKSTVTVSTESNAHYKISFTNLGETIPLEERQHIFEIFYRGRAAKKMRPEGTGIGLYIAKTMIEKVKGELSFSSKNGKTIFTVSLPLKHNHK